MDLLQSKWAGFIDFCRTPALPYQKYGDRADVESSYKKLYAALAAEFLGMLLFSLYGGEASDSAAAYGNGLTLAVLVYATANVSGGHLNPAVTLATMITGHLSWKKGLLYMLAQFLGGITGVLFQVALIPTAHPGMGNSGPGCFTHLGGKFVRVDQMFGWEVVMTFLLVTVVYAVAVSKPGHGSIGPLIVGFTLFASAFIGGPLTGAALNPARVLGPTIIYNCFWNTVLVYMSAEYLGGIIAAILALLLYGPGPEHGGEAETEGLAVQMAAGPGKAGERVGLIGVTANSAGGQGPWDARF